MIDLDDRSMFSYAGGLMPDLSAIPEVVIWSILGTGSGWLILWLTTRRPPKRLPVVAITFVAIAASNARQRIQAGLVKPLASVGSALAVAFATWSLLPTGAILLFALLGGGPAIPVAVVCVLITFGLFYLGNKPRPNRCQRFTHVRVAAGLTVSSFSDLTCNSTTELRELWAGAARTIAFS